uniref:Neur_chan_LBD domain-containing protein n=1 Tax=Steinernema glaseri TaxID=37863 RepID=A0A1I8AIY1_9BILA
MNILLFSALNGAFVLPSQLKLVQDLLETYDRKAKPTWDNSRPINVTFSMDLYQILELIPGKLFIGVKDVEEQN